MDPTIKKYSLICILYLFLFPVLDTINVIHADYNKLRIEQEDKLLIPLDKAEEVWNFLHDRYVLDSEALKQLDPLLSSYYHEEEFTDTYFDTPDLRLLSMQSGVRHRRRINLTDPDDRKSGRELMQIKLNDISQNILERGEIKFKIKHLITKNSFEDNHPMLGIVKSSQREDFKQRLKSIGLEPLSMQPILTVHDLRKRIYITRDSKPFMSISFDSASASIWWAKTKFVEIEPELNEIVFTEADQETKKYMEAILHKITAEIKQQFPYIETNLTPKYNKSFYSLEAQLPVLRFLVRGNLHTPQSAFAILFIALVITGASSYFIVYKSHQRKI